jgi:alpha-1,3-glucosyltransferase
MLAPFGTDPKVIYQIFHRVFPVARGLYEDKVANFWCALSVLVKLKQLFSLEQLIQISIISTLIAVLPACFYVFRKPVGISFIYALAISSLGFFLFSFQVHEKSVLLPLLPIAMLYPQEPKFVIWFHNVALYSLWPLLKKDGLLIPYIASILLWNSLLISQFHKSPWRWVVFVSFVNVDELRNYDGISCSRILD